MRLFYICGPLLTVQCVELADSAMAAKRVPSRAVQEALEKAAKLAERQAVMNAAETTVLSASPDVDLELPWAIQPIKPCTQL